MSARAPRAQEVHITNASEIADASTGTIGENVPLDAAFMGAETPAGKLAGVNVNAAGELIVSGGGDAEGEPNAAVPTKTMAVGGKDSTNKLQTFVTEAGDVDAGTQRTTEASNSVLNVAIAAILALFSSVLATIGGAVKGFALQISGSDGALARLIRTDADGHVQVDVLSGGGTVGGSLEATQQEVLDTQIERYLELDRCTAIAGWSAILDAAAIATTINHVPHEDKMLSLTFNKAGGTNVVSGIQKTLATIDASAFEGQTLMTGRIYFTSLTDVDYAFLRLGTDNSNYAEWRAGADLLTAGVFNHVQTEAHQLTSNVGTGCNFSAITYVAFGFATNLAADTLNGTILDYLNLLSLPSVNAAIGVDVIAGNTPASVRVQKFGTPNNANVTTNNGASSSGTLRVTLASDGTGLTNVTPPDPGGAETITAVDGSDPVIGQMVTIALDTVVVTVAGILTADAGDTAIDMEVAGSESWVLKILPQPVGDAYDAIGIRFDSVGANTPTYTNKLRQRK